jgi:hypothetical protein
MRVGAAIMQQFLIGVLVKFVALVRKVVTCKVTGSTAHMNLAPHHVNDGLTIANAGVAKLLHLRACG